MSTKSNPIFKKYHKVWAGLFIVTLMMIKSLTPPGFFVDSLPDISNTDCRELIRCIELRADASDIFVWLKQLQIAPYSYDFIDNRFRKSPEYIVENLPPLKVNSHFLLSFHIFGFEENSFIVVSFLSAN